MSSLERVTDTVSAAMQRRILFKRAARGAAAAAMATAVARVGGLSTPAQAAVTIGTPSAAQDVAILNFALNLEYLEAEYYLRATTGAGLSAADRLGGDGATQPGTVSAPAKTLVSFATPIIGQLAGTIAADEQAHVRFLRANLGSLAVAAPAIDVNAAFSTLAVAAGIIKSGQVFNPYQDENAFLLGAYVFEDVGVTAYGGAAAAIFTPAYLTAAAQILAMEAYHAGTIRTLLAIRGGGNATDAVSAVRSQLSIGIPPGTAGSDDYGGIDPNGVVHLAPRTNNALAYTRTPTQVLKIVYGNTVVPTTGTNAITPGLFFPQGMNGTLN